MLLPLLSLLALAQEPELPDTDEELRALVESVGTSEDHDGAHVATALWATDVEVEDSGLSHIRERQVMVCLDWRCAPELARLRFDWDPASNMVEVKKLRILREDGTVEDLPTDGGIDLPQPQWGIYWGAQMRLVPVPRLYPGDALEVETYMKGFLIAYLGDEDAGGVGSSEGDERYIPPMRGHFYDVVTFQRGTPVKLRHYQVRTPLDKPVQFEVYNGEAQGAHTFDDEHLRYAFWKEDQPAYHHEPRAVDGTDVMAKVVMATVPDWPAKSRWFYEVNEGQFEATPAIQAKVAELTAGLRTDREKVAALVHWSADEIRYSGITMGQGEGYTLHTGEMVFRDRSGVCKDKASMAITLLRTAGYEAYSAMTMAGSRVERIPADQFNHAVVAWKRPDGEWEMLDPTWVPFSPELWSSAEGEQHFVIGTEAGEELMKTAAFDAADNALVLEARSELAADGTLTSRLAWTGRAYAEQRLRRMLAQSHTTRERDSFVEQSAAHLGASARVEAKLPTYAQLRDVTRPVTLGARVEVPGYAREAGDRLVFSPPTARHLITSSYFAPYLEVAGPEEREQPLLLWAPRQREVTETLMLPPGFSVAHLPEDQHIDGPVASLSTHTEVRGRKLTYTQTLTIKQREISSSQYANFREVVQAALELDQDLVVLERR